MPRNSTGTTKAQAGKRRVSRPRRVKDPSARRGRRGTPERQRENVEAYPYVLQDGEPAYVLVPIQEYEELVKTSMAASAIARTEDRDDDFVDADEFFLELAGERIAEARKAAGLTQKQLGAKLKIPQSQISRIERNPDRTTVRTLKRIARALGVNVQTLVG